ncbi:phosphate transport system permease protein PstC [Peptococcaceae bacterium CEB3]|nr:phosphate transport system permease protein PstC [Peptococcaceae bacterium CEB3]
MKKKRPRASWGDRILRSASGLTAVLVVGIMIWLGWEMFVSSRQSLHQFGWAFLGGRVWDPVHRIFGALPFIYGTLVTSIVALVIAGPIGLGVAIFLSEMAPATVRSVVGFLVELLAAIPSVVLGLWGIFVLAPFLGKVVEPWLGRRLGFIPLFHGAPVGVDLLNGGLILAIMILPTIASISREVMTAVPTVQREAALALGATKWEMIRIGVLAYAKSGIIGSVILGLGRALGETMAVTMVIGNMPNISPSLFSTAYSMAAVIANEFTEATYGLYLSALMEVGLILFAITLLLNIFARLLVWSVARGPKGGHLV